MRRKAFVYKFLLLDLIIVLTLNWCAIYTTYKTAVYDRSKLLSIANWYIDFAYEAGEFEQKISGSGETEASIKKVGQFPRDLQLRDDIFFYLKDKYQISVVRDTNKATGFIKIHPVHFLYGGFKSLDVTIYDSENNLIARIKIKNSNSWMGDEEFAEYCAKAIAKTILTSE
jgi:hypothetical protein